MAKGKRTQHEYQSALNSAIFGRYEAEVFVDVWNELVDLREREIQHQGKILELEADIRTLENEQWDEGLRRV